MFDWVTDPAIWASLVTLTAMEIVLGIDNIVFISVIVSRLPPEHAVRARQLGLGMALVFRVVLLLARPHPACRRLVPCRQGDP